MSLTWIWQGPEWPRFTWDTEALASGLREVTQLQGKLLGKIEHVPQDASNASVLDAQLQNIIQSSAIEGEHLNAESVRSSLAKRLGVKMQAYLRRQLKQKVWRTYYSMRRKIISKH